jgi:hypothetical protein
MDDEMRAQLIQMGINPENIGSGNDDAVLPPLPPSDPGAMQRNHFDGFYKRSSREFWNEAHITQHKVEEFKKCQHYFMKENDEIRCSKCNVGWVAPTTFHTQDGKLFENDKELLFTE